MFDEYLIPMPRPPIVRGNAEISESQVQPAARSGPSSSNSPTTNISIIEPCIFTKEYMLPRDLEFQVTQVHPIISLVLLLAFKIGPHM